MPEDQGLPKCNKTVTAELKIGSQSVFALFIFSQKMFSRMAENVLADASLERPADLIHSLIGVLWLKRCDINWLCECAG